MANTTTVPSDDHAAFAAIRIDWNDPGKGQRLRAEYWKRRALHRRTEARSQETEKRRGFRCRRLIGF